MCVALSDFDAVNANLYISYMNKTKIIEFLATQMYTNWTKCSKSGNLENGDFLNIDFNKVTKTKKTFVIQF